SLWFISLLPEAICNDSSPHMSQAIGAGSDLRRSDNLYYSQPCCARKFSHIARSPHPDAPFRCGLRRGESEMAMVADRHSARRSVVDSTLSEIRSDEGRRRLRAATQAIRSPERPPSPSYICASPAIFLILSALR